MASNEIDNCALAFIKSSLAKNPPPFFKSPRYGLRLSVKEIRILIISLFSANWSSFTELLISTILAGSIYEVLPVADSPWIIPGIFLLNADCTGITILPSLTDNSTSFSTIPSFWAFFNRALKSLKTSDCFSIIFFLIFSSSTEALSLITPWLFITLLILSSTSGKIFTPIVSFLKKGYSWSSLFLKKLINDFIDSRDLFILFISEASIYEPIISAFERMWLISS